MPLEQFFQRFLLFNSDNVRIPAQCRLGSPVIKGEVHNRADDIKCDELIGKIWESLPVDSN